MFRVAYEMIKDFGALGVGIIQLGVIVFLGWKLATNHLKHIKDKIDWICTKLDVFDTDLNKTKERVSKLEGKVE